MELVKPDGRGDIFTDLTLVSGEHHSLCDAFGLESLDRIGGISLDSVRDHNVSDVCSIDADVYDRAVLLTRFPLRSDRFHHLGVAHADGLSVHHSAYSVTGDLLDIFDRASIGLVRISVLK